MSAAPETEEPVQQAPSWSQMARRLFSTALRHRATVEEAEDLVQETMQVALERPDWFEQGRDPIPAMRSILKNRLIDRRRHQSMRRRKEPMLRLVKPDPDPEDLLERSRASDLRRAFLAQLDPDERRLFQTWLLQRRGDLPGPKAAASLDLTVSAYEAAKKRLRRRCHRILQDLELDPADLFGGAR